MTNQENARKLLTRLAKDDEFRARMETDPVAAFSEYGFAIDHGIAPEKISLPSKDEIGKSIDLLSKQIDATNGWIMFCR